MAIKNTILEPASITNFDYSSRAENTSFKKRTLGFTGMGTLTNVASGAQYQVLGRTGHSNEGKVIGTGILAGFATANGGTILLQGSDESLDAIEAEYAATGDSTTGFNINYAGGVDIPNGEQWTILSAVAGSNDHVGVLATTIATINSENVLFIQSIKPNVDAGIISTAGRESSITSATSLTRPVLIHYDDGKAVA